MTDSVGVTANGLTKVFGGGKVAAEDVSFSARPGEVFGLLGVNGAGKTTTLRMLSTVLRPTRGSATVAGFDVARDSQRVRASIGFLSSSTALYGRLSGRETLVYFGELFGLSPAVRDARIEHCRGLLQLDEFWARPCETMSTGQKQRISIARSVLHDPPVLFFDEPTAGLDIVTAQTVMEFIEAARADGKTIIFSTHIMSEAERLCDRIAIIHDGRIVATGTVPELTGGRTLERAFLDCVGYQRELARA
ncbi:MAG: ABC transporter ATP-binding protein [Fimbriimonadaceae bacterium]|nr:ABC transporter ATP-binding protein [Fimbriimonadaceae bacterium]